MNTNITREMGGEGDRQRERERCDGDFVSSASVTLYGPTKALFLQHNRFFQAKNAFCASEWS